MKKIALLLTAALALFAYTGFMQPKPGAWAKYEIYSENGKGVMIQKYLGTTIYKGKKVHVVETKSDFNGFQTIMQQWSAYNNESAIEKSIMLTPQGLMCMEQEMFTSGGKEQQSPGSLKTPKEYSPKKSNFKLGTYTLPNGKKIKVAIFKEKDGEIWVSSEVPFGTVQVIHEGKPVVKLVDFGLSGAKAAIPLKEAKACAPMHLPFPAM